MAKCIFIIVSNRSKIKIEKKTFLSVFPLIFIRKFQRLVQFELFKKNYFVFFKFIKILSMFLIFLKYFNSIDWKSSQWFLLCGKIKTILKAIEILNEFTQLFILCNALSRRFKAFSKIKIDGH